MVISRLSEQNKVLAQRLALLDERVGTLSRATIRSATAMTRSRRRGAVGKR
jgi:hypothetical protein